MAWPQQTATPNGISSRAVYTIRAAGLTMRSNVSSARKVSMYVVREITGMSMEDIGSEFGGRDHPPVVYSINEMQKKLETDTRPRETVEDIIKNVRT